MSRNDCSAQLERLLSERILIIDGAMGTMVQARELSEDDYRGERFVDHPLPLSGDSEVLVLTKPSVVTEIHDSFLAAGADILETITFGANAIAQADYGMETHVYELNLRSAEI
ncbi:MAG: homocysteine S-methyltransferase family protein, partial [Myxococcota bacterium]